MNLKRFFTAAACALCLATTAFSQEDEGNPNPTIVASLHDLKYTPRPPKNTVGSVLGEVATAVLAGQTSKEMLGYEGAVRAAVLKGMSQSFRIRAIDGPLTEEEMAMPFTVYVDGDISNMTTTTKTEVEEYEEKGKKKTRSRTYFRGQVGLALQVKDASNDVVIASPTFNIYASDMAWIETPDGAMNTALKYLSNKVRIAFNDMFPLTGRIIERAGERNDKQKEVYIDLGTANGIAVGNTLTVFKVKTIAGKYAKEELAKLKVKKVEGDEVSFCKVVSHGKDLKAALDAGEKLVIITN